MGFAMHRSQLQQNSQDHCCMDLVSCSFIALAVANDQLSEVDFKPIAAKQAECCVAINKRVVCY
jgi:ribulose-5-phosphate 4-epimerase/fuculose-1-phosphate aldolase